MPIGAPPKEIIELTDGRWICEIPELVGKREIEEAKAFASRQIDEARLAYAKTTDRRPRQFVLLGTVNPQADGEYLLDPTGGRRFLPIVVTRCDPIALARDRDQIWGEAAAIEATGEPLYLDEQASEMARKIQSSRTVSDPWADRLGPIVADQRGIVASASIWRVLGLDVSRQDPHAARRVARVMADLGFRKVQRRRGGINIRGFSNLDDTEDQTWLDT